MKRQPYDIPDILESLKHDVEKGCISIEDAAEELYCANWTNYIDVEKTRRLLNL